MKNNADKIKKMVSPWMTVMETSRYLQLSETTLRNMIKHNKVPSVKIGRSIRINRNTLDQFLQKGLAS